MFRFLSRIIRGSIPTSEPFSELGALGTHSRVVTDWQPGPTSWRPVHVGDGATEPQRRSVSTRGPLVLRGDQTLNVFQGEATPAPAPGTISSADDFLEAYSKASRDTGYPS